MGLFNGRPANDWRRLGQPGEGYLFDLHPLATGGAVALLKTYAEAVAIHSRIVSIVVVWFEEA